MWDVLDELFCGVGVGVRSGGSLHFYLGWVRVCGVEGREGDISGCEGTCYFF